MSCTCHALVINRRPLDSRPQLPTYYPRLLQHSAMFQESDFRFLNVWFDVQLAADKFGVLDFHSRPPWQWLDLPLNPRSIPRKPSGARGNNTTSLIPVTPHGALASHPCSISQIVVILVTDSIFGPSLVEEGRVRRAHHEGGGCLCFNKSRGFVQLAHTWRPTTKEEAEEEQAYLEL